MTNNMIMNMNEYSPNLDLEVSYNKSAPHINIHVSRGRAWNKDK